MTIRNKQNYLDSIWDWSILNGCFKGKIAPTDIDGLVERNGRFLLLETKSPGVPINTGQQRTHDALLATGVFTVMVIWGNAGQPEKLRVSIQHNGKVAVQEMEADTDVLRDVVRRWFLFADRQFAITN